MSRKSPDSTDSLLGYANQIYRGLFYLITKRESIYIEKNDDVFVEDEYGFLILEQVKDKNTKVVRVNSSDFLDTFLNWTYLHVNHKDKFNDRTKCVLALLQGNKTDDLMLDCEMAKNESDSESVYLQILGKVKDKPLYRDAFTNNKKSVIEIIQKFEIYKPTINTKTDLENTIKEWLDNVVAKESIKNYTDQLIAWFFKAVVNEKSKALKLIKVSYEDFIKKNFQLNGETITIVYPLKEQINKKDDEYLRTYVNQLKAINIDNRTIEDAIIDCLSWEYLLENDFKDGRITQPEINNTYLRLCTRWREIKTFCACSSSGIPLGQSIYLKSIEEKLTVSGVSIYGDDRCISRGAYNYLADDIDKYGIFWHPNYRDLLNAK